MLEDELGDIAAQDVGEGNIKKLLSGVRLLEKLGWIKSTVRPGDWYLVLGVEKERERQGKGAVKEWASMEALRYMAGVVHTKAEWEILALAALSCAHCLRASEAITARAEGSELVFRGTKSRSGEQRQEMGQWTAKWAASLARLRASHGYHPDVPAWFQETDGLHRGLHSILDRPGGSFKYLRWHSFRRFGAAQLHGLGLPVRFIMLWGGDGSRRQWRRYTTRRRRDGSPSEGDPSPCPSTGQAQRRRGCSLGRRWGCGQAGSGVSSRSPMSDLLGQSRVRRAVLPRCKSDHARSRQRETSSRSRTRQSGHRPRPSNARGGPRQGRGGDCRRTAGAQASRTEKRQSVRQHHGDVGEVTIEDERLARAISELPRVK